MSGMDEEGYMRGWTGREARHERDGRGGRRDMSGMDGEGDMSGMDREGVET